MKLDVAFKKLSPLAIVPRKMTYLAAGSDLYAANEEPLNLPVGKFVIVPIGIAISLPAGCEAQVRPRSGLAAKHGIGVLNSPGTIDADYRGELKVILFNFGDKDFVVERGMRIAQMVVARCADLSFIEVEELDETIRGSSGFGESG